MAVQARTFTPARLLAYVIVVLGTALLPLLISGRWDWWQAWVYAAVNLVGFVAGRRLAALRHPGLMAERARMFEREDAKPWDKVLAPLVVLLTVLIGGAAGVDRLIGAPAGFGLAANLLALAVILAGYSFGTWAMLVNPFFAGVVRMQAERGHTVITAGPYRWVRHPGYLGTLAFNLFVPLLLDSAWAFVPVAIFIAVIVARTYLEDRTLQAELPGYRDYTHRVRYRLIPGIW